MTKSGRSASTGPALPVRLRRLLVLIVALGIVSVAYAIPQAISEKPRIGSFIPAIAFFLIGDVALMNIRFGQSRYSFTWSELAVVFGLVMLPHGWGVLVAPFSVRPPPAVLPPPPAQLPVHA